MSINDNRKAFGSAIARVRELQVACKKEDAHWQKVCRFAILHQLRLANLLFFNHLAKLASSSNSLDIMTMQKEGEKLGILQPEDGYLVVMDILKELLYYDSDAEDSPLACTEFDERVPLVCSFFERVHGRSRTGWD